MAGPLRQGESDAFGGEAGGEARELAVAVYDPILEALAAG